MDPFTYLTVLISIVLGFGITQLLSGIGRLLQQRHRVRPYWPALVWVGVLLVLHVQTWWAMFGLRTLHTWSFYSFLLILLQPLLLYLLVALLLPDNSAETANDLEANYYAHSRWFFALAVLLIAGSLARDRVLTGTFPRGLNLAVHGLLFLGWGVGAITRRESYHRLLVIYTVVIMAGYIALLFRTLP